MKQLLVVNPKDSHTGICEKEAAMLQHFTHTPSLGERALVVVLLIGLLGWLPVGLAYAVDLTVTNIEVTQAIQTTTNTIRLVAQRSTAVRATLVDLDTSGPVPNVTGTLHVFVGGTEITPTAGLAPI